ncbi:SRPBCC family protein [Brevibacillus fluminis]|uniref:SRPBCC family protein n=1 Tax=Brevibacillus fluminis TaxID=511487 RepID=UPI003F890F17
MPTIETDLFIQAPPEICFDCSRSIELHMESTAQTRERAIAGRTSGLIELGETVTWEAVHFGIKQRLTAKITEFDRPARFVDEMVQGAFQSFHHTHEFTATADGTWMKDTFRYTSPLGWLGKLADWLFLEAYMKNFLVQRNHVIKQAAEKAWESQRDC